MCLNCTAGWVSFFFILLLSNLQILSRGWRCQDTNTKLRNERPPHSFLKLYLYLYICCVCWMHSDHFFWVPLFLKLFHFYIASFSHQNTNALILFSIFFFFSPKGSSAFWCLFYNSTPAGLVTNSILLCYLFTIKDKCKNCVLA